MLAAALAFDLSIRKSAVPNSKLVLKDPPSCASAPSSHAMEQLAICKSNIQRIMAQNGCSGREHLVLSKDIMEPRSTCKSDTQDIIAW